MKDNAIFPIDNPKVIYPGLELFKISVKKITKDSTGIKSIVGDTVHYAAVDTVKVKTVEMNEGETGHIVNKATDNIRIPFDQTGLSLETDGSLFDKEEKAQAAAKSINSVNMKKVQAIIEELNQAGGFLEQLLREGA